ncbi:D-lactate dehydrogenase [Ascosphaera apis ARSEF 7405]|uniref:D-lactate dehydrogenase n=1 Tax=Ascosphaera apis ARSEF 7405 TaxID=392613 RepID=A0A167VQV1_9EURO|nr:D-lactate dehydrogenase [Ascosphaera apis ARSEF 7405]
MKIAVFSCHDYEKAVFQKWNKKFGFDIDYLPQAFCKDTAGDSKPYDAICTFVNDIMDAEALEILKQQKTRLIVLRCAGYDTVDLKAADKKGITVMRVPAYSPNAIAEFTIASVMALNRHIPEAVARIASGNFDVNGLIGFDVHAKTVGVIGTGRIGKVVARTFGLGFHCNMLLYDIVQAKEMTDLGFKYVSLDELLEKSDVISFHCPATKATEHLVNKESLAKMKDGVLLVNTSRGKVVDTPALLDAIDSGKVRGAALDVYEGEGAQFYRTEAQRKTKDQTLDRIIANPRVLLTGHLGYFTNEALNSIAEVTLRNVANFQKGDLSANIAIEKYE